MAFGGLAIQVLGRIYPFSFGNAWATTWHIVLFVLQVIFILGLPLSAFIGLPCPVLLYTPASILCFAGFIVLNLVLCKAVLNGPSGRTFYAAGPRGTPYAADVDDEAKRLIPRGHPSERWVFINGVAVGSHWMQSNLDRLAATFRRPVLGIHNATYGIPFDVLECMIQRTFGYPTDDIRTAYGQIVKMLADESVKKLVLIAHSQGSIEAGMALDWLYATMSTEQIQKLEIYTFGNAANHWNCPMRKEGHPAVEHIEHYANEWDWVSRFGILHFRPMSLKSAAEQPKHTISATASNDVAKAGTDQVHESRKAGVERSSTTDLEAKLATPQRFAGRLFLRHASGHLFNQHYLDNMFPMSWKDEKLDEVIEEDNGYMDQEIDEQALSDDDTVKMKPPGGRGAGRKIKELSRLWEYANGSVPKK